jgi:hypothetical protein
MLAGVKLNTLPSFTAFWFAAVSFFPNEYIYLDYKIHKIPPAVQCPAPPNATDTCAVPCSEIIAAGPDADVRWLWKHCEVVLSNLAFILLLDYLVDRLSDLDWN